MISHLVGVDSGGTHTNIRLRIDESERTIGELDKSLTSNRSDSELKEVFGEILSLVHSHTLGAPTAVWINAAGFAAASSGRFQGLIQSSTDGADLTIGICNDGVGLLLAHDPELVVVIAGTGSVAMARTPQGEVVTRGGDEWVVADYGSAFWIGLAGIRAAYNALEGGPETGLLNCLLEHFSPFRDDEARKDQRSGVRAIARRLASLGTDTKPTIASFAPQVTRQAELGDDESQRLVRSAVDELASAAARVYRQLAARVDDGRTVPPRFRISGSVAYRSPFYFETFRASLDQFLYDVREASGLPLEVSSQMNGLSEALELARLVRDGVPIPQLDDQHPSLVVSPRLVDTSNRG